MENNNETIYGVTGSTGHLGQLIIAELLRKVRPQQIIAIARDVEKAQSLVDKGIEVRIASYQNAEALSAALLGIDKLLLVSSNDMSTSRADQHKAVIDAAIENGVEGIAYTSILRADTTTNPLAADHKATEEYLKDSGINYALLRHGWYHENYLDTLSTADTSGTIVTSTHKGRISSASRADYAAGDVAVLLQDFQSETYEFAGDRAWDFEELTEIATTLLGKTITLQNLSTDEHIKLLEGFGVDTGTAHFVAAIDASIAAGELQDDQGQLSSLIDRQTTSLYETLKNR